MRALRQGLDEHTVHTFGPDRLRGLAIRGRGQPYATRLALASGGGIDYERIQVLDGASLSAEHLERCGEGLHHLGSSVDDLEAAIAAMAGRGYAVLQAGAGVGDSGDAADAYFDTARDVGGIREAIAKPSRMWEPARGSGPGRVLRPVPLTTSPVFPLDSVSPRFQIRRLFPDYRNHFSPSSGMEPLESELGTLLP